MRQQMLDRDFVTAVSSELRNEFLQGIIELKSFLIEQSHQRGHADRFGNRTQQEHRILGRRTKTASH